MTRTPSPSRAHHVIVLSLATLLAACSEPAAHAATVNDPVERGRYLVTLGACHDCHTPKLMTAEGPVLDSTRLLSGHPAGDPVGAVPAGVIMPAGEWGAITNGQLTAWAGPWGTSFSANLTPDQTGLAGWTPEVFIETIRKGKHAGVGRSLLPPMPWQMYMHMTDQDLRSVFADLQSLPPIPNRVPAPIPPTAAVAQQ